MRIRTLTLAIIITAVCMASCSGASKSTSESGMTAGTGMAGDGVVEKTLKLGSFNAIKSETIVDIHFAQGAKRSVRCAPHRTRWTGLTYRLRNPH